MHKFPLILAMAALAGLMLCTIPDAPARGRAYGHVVAHGTDGARSPARGVAAVGPRGSLMRGRALHGDGQGNANGHSRARVEGAAGGSARRQGSFYRHADGSAGRQGRAAFTGPNGASGSTAGSVARDADGSYAGSRSTTVTGRNGNTYEGATRYDSDSGRTRTVKCTNAAGEVVSCRGG